MIAVLERASRLIACLAESRGSRSLVEVAAATGLPNATASRLLRDLQALGWVDRAGARGAFALGPRADALVARRPYRGALVAAAEPVLARLVRQGATEAAIVVARGAQRFELLRHGEQGPQRRLSEHGHLYASAAGRVLVATMPWRDRQRVIDRLGLPRQREWPGAGTRADLAAACAQIVRHRRCENAPPGPWNGVGVPVPDGEGGVAALGVAFPKERWDRSSVARAVRAGASIARNLERQRRTG